MKTGEETAMPEESTKSIHENEHFEERTLIGRWKGKVRILGDIDSTGESWDAELSAPEWTRELYRPI